jgi:hypothetical protein
LERKTRKSGSYRADAGCCVLEDFLHDLRILCPNIFYPLTIFARIFFLPLPKFAYMHAYDHTRKYPGDEKGRA